MAGTSPDKVNSTWIKCSTIHNDSQCHIIVIFGKDLRRYVYLCVSALNIWQELLHVLAAQLYVVPNGHIIWRIGDPSNFLRVAWGSLESNCASWFSCSTWSPRQLACQNKTDSDGLTAFFLFSGLFATASSGSSAPLALNRIALMWPVQNDFASIRHQKHVSVICVNILKCFRRNFEAVISW